jgi:hypothetical protein
MKVTIYIAVLAIANLLLADATSSVLAAGEGRNPHKQHGTVSTSHSSKQSTNQAPQWSADPARGWVRSDKSDGIHGRKRLSTTPKQTDRKNKGSGKASKRF